MWLAQCRNLPARSQLCIDCCIEFLCMRCWYNGGTGALSTKRAVFVQCVLACSPRAVPRHFSPCRSRGLRHDAPGGGGIYSILARRRGGSGSLSSWPRLAYKPRCRCRRVALPAASLAGSGSQSAAASTTEKKLPAIGVTVVSRSPAWARRAAHSCSERFSSTAIPTLVSLPLMSR